MPIRMAGALLTGFVAGLVGRGRQGWISATLGASLALLCLAWLSSEPGVVELVALPVFFISLLALAPGYGLSILGPMIAFGFFYSFAGSDEPEAALASGISIFVGSFVAAGLCCAVDGRGIRGALQTLVIPVAGVALLVLATLGALAEGGSAYGALEWLRTIALAFLVVAVPIEFGYLVGRFVAWLRRMRGGPTVTPTSARGPSEMVEEKP